MNRIAQRTPTDCGVACVAMIAGCEWEHAAYAIFGPRWGSKRTYATSATQVRDALRRLGWSATDAKMVSFRRNHTYGSISLVNVERFKINNTKRWSAHWIVRAEDGSLIDPAREQPLSLEQYEPKGEIRLVWTGGK